MVIPFSSPYLQSLTGKKRENKMYLLLLQGDGKNQCDSKITTTCFSTSKFHNRSTLQPKLFV